MTFCTKHETYPVFEACPLCELKTMRGTIGKVYANTEREEDRADPTFIENGWITGDGLLGEVIETVDKLQGLIIQRGWYSDSPQMLKAIDEARHEYFDALKAIEEAAIEREKD